MSQPPHQPPQDGSSWNQQPGQYGPPQGQQGATQGQYGPPPGQYGPPPSGGSGNGKVIGIIAAVVAVVAAVVLVLVFTVFKGDDEDTRADGPLASAEALASELSDAAASAGSAGSDLGSDVGSAPEPGPLVDPTLPPDGLGDDDALDALAQECFDGDMQSCDDLFAQSDLGSEYEAYGDTCAGRQPPNTLTLCTITFPDA